MKHAIKTAEQLISKYCIQNHRELNLEEIANAEMLIIEEVLLNGLLGRILYNDEFGLIQVDKSISNEGLKRFTIAHEMGHFFLSKNSQINKHGCSYNSLGNYSENKNQETEANHFAAELLMHKPWFIKFTNNIPVCLDLIKLISREFNVSLTAAAIRYAEIGQFPIAVIMSKDNFVQWSFISGNFPFKNLPMVKQVPIDSNARDCFNNKEIFTDEDLILAANWFNVDFRSNKSKYLYEQSISITVTKSVLTLLWSENYNFRY